MGKATKLILGLATLWPPLFVVIFILFVFWRGFLFPGDPQSGFLLISSVHFITMVWICVLLLIYILNVFRNERVASDKKALWAVVLFLGNVVTMPVYWYLYIWPEPSKTGEGVSAGPT